MAVTSLFHLDKIVLPSSVEFQSLKNMRWDAGIQTLTERGAGEVHPNFLATGVQKPLVGFTTPQLDTLLTNVPLIGASITGGITTYFKQAAVTGRVARATTTHKKVAIALACVYWTSIKLTHNGVAEADVVIVAVYDGTNAPFAYTGSVALSGTIIPQNYFGAGPCSINGSLIGAVQDITVNSGIRLTEQGGESEVYNTFVGIEVTEPHVDITTKHAVNWATIGLVGTALNGTTGLTFYARKFAADGQRVADGTAEHILFNAPFGRAIPQNSSGDMSNPISDTLRVELRQNTTAATPLTITPASAIS